MSQTKGQKKIIDSPANGLPMPHDIVAHRMTVNVPSMRQTATAHDAQTLITSRSAEWRSINYLYVLDGKKKLVGVVSIKELFRAAGDATLRSIMTRDVVSVRIHSDQERAALLAVEHSLKAIPVVDKEEVFLGAVTSDTILRILHEEDIEDVLRLSGISGHSSDIAALVKARASVWARIRSRIGWLLLGIGGGFIAAEVVQYFEQTLQESLLVAFFVPLVMYLSAAVGSQTQTLYIRTMALRRFSTARYFAQEIAVGAGIGLFCGLVVALVTLVLWHDPRIASALFLALVIAIILSTIISLFIPFALARMGKDPAVGTGPFASALQDILSLAIYLAVATVLL